MFSRPAPRSLPTMLRGALLRSVLIVACFGASFSAADAFLPDVGIMQVVPPAEGAVQQAEVLDAEDRANARAGRLILAHGCWVGAGPKDVIPGGVVLTRDGGQPRFYGSDRMVTIAFEQVLGAVRDGAIVYVDHGVRVHAFCR